MKTAVRYLALVTALLFQLTALAETQESNQAPNYQNMVSLLETSEIHQIVDNGAFPSNFWSNPELQTILVQELLDRKAKSKMKMKIAKQY